MDPSACDFQFRCEARRSCVLRTEELSIGPTITTKTDRGGSVWLHFSQSGLSINPIARKYSARIVGEENQMAKIARFHKLGGPEVLKIEDLPSRQPSKGEVVLRVQAIGLNRAES